MGKENTNTSERELRELINQYIKEIKFGNITLIIQDGKVIQVDKTEKIRL